jgi:mono/diheme cytochrome c family protein
MAVRVDDDKKYKFWHMVVLCAATALAVLFVFVQQRGPYRVREVLATSASAQEPTATDEVREGKRLAILICGNCHVVVRDQLLHPILDPPAPSFDTIAQRGTMMPDSLRTFLATTHRDGSNPTGMPNPRLLPDQIERVTAYILSLHKQR